MVATTEYNMQFHLKMEYEHEKREYEHVCERKGERSVTDSKMNSMNMTM